MTFLVIWLAWSLIAIMVVTGPLWFDRAVVVMMRVCRIYAYPNAIRIAISLEHDAGEWHLDHHSLVHPKIGTLDWLSGRAEPLFITFRLPGDCRASYKPKWIERRILANAINAHLAMRLDAHLDRHLPRL
jgi:hypothetical protein